MKRTAIAAAAILAATSAAIANPAYDWHRAFTEKVSAPMQTFADFLAQHCAENTFDIRACPSAMEAVRQEIWQQHKWLNANPGPTCIRKQVSEIDDIVVNFNDAFGHWTDGIRYYYSGRMGAGKNLVAIGREQFQKATADLDAAAISLHTAVAQCK